MAREFRLLSAQTRQRRRTAKHLFQSDDDPQPINIDLSRSSDPSGSAISIVIGSNGTGKSRLFGDICDSFLTVSGLHGAKRGFPLDYLSYSVDGRFCQVGSGDRAYAELPEQNSIPSRVIAVAMTPFDKFPLEPHSRIEPYEPTSTPFYNYVGMRDRMNRASVTALLYRAIENIMRRRDGGSRARIANVFGLLGYYPVISVGLRLDLNSEELDRILTLPDIPPELLGRSFMRERLRDNLMSGRIDTHALRRSLFAVSKHGISQRRIRIDIDLLNPRIIDVDFEDLALLRRVGLLRLESLEVTKKSGDQIDLRQASSGEISIFTTFVAISSVLEDGSLVLIDEPETSLHPEWQNRFVDLIRDTFCEFSGCHFILSTHSPLIVGDMSSTSSVYSLDSRSVIDGFDVSRKSSDFLLATAFHTPTPSNYYVQEELVRALRLAADGKEDTEEFIQTVQGLVQISKRLESAVGPVPELIAELALSIDSAERA